MKLQITQTKGGRILYIAKSFRENGKCSSKIIQKLGAFDELSKTHGDPIAWAKQYAKELTEKEKVTNKEILVKYSPAKVIGKDVTNSFNGGYIFLQKIYYELGLHNICDAISSKYEFEFDLDSILSRLIYSRLIQPASKLATLEFSRKFMQPPNFDLHQIYRALEVISKESYFIQSEVYKNSLTVCERKTGVLYYDCTNYFFEIEEASGLRQYGYSKEHRPNPIVQMGLFMDAGGIPLAFSISAGNTNEQTTLLPLEKKILEDFNLAKFVVCTDAGLSSLANRKFNNMANRGFVTTQSVKKLVGHLKDWALDPKGWRITGSEKVYDISEATDPETVFYKERWINENEFSQRLIVTFSIKYKNYLRSIRNAQIDRALKAMKNDADKLPQNNYKRFIKKTNVTPDGEVASKTLYELDANAIAEEEKYDGFYGTCTNLNDAVSEIIKINQRRWEIEECFRIIKSELKARPVYLTRDDRIKAHFMTCFIALLLYRLLEKKLDEKFTCDQIIDGLRSMNFHKVRGEGYIPSYTRTDFTDALHEKFGFRTDYEILTMQKVKEITTK